MRCVSPISIRRGKYIDTVPCGYCNFCLEMLRNDWTFRVSVEVRHSDTAYFITLTYADEFIPFMVDGQVERIASYGPDPEKFANVLPTLCKMDVQKFFRKIRKVLGVKFRYFVVGQYGETTGRPHYHVIFFNLPKEALYMLQGLWQFGNIDIGDINPASIHYVTGYVIARRKADRAIERALPFALMSRRPGIGAKYLVTHRYFHKYKHQGYSETNGIKARLPRYYKERIFSALERESLAAEATRLALEVERTWLSEQSHPCPERYLEEVVRAKYNSLELKNRKTKF